MRKIFECKCGVRIDIETEENKMKCMCCGKVIKFKDSKGGVKSGN